MDVNLLVCSDLHASERALSMFRGLVSSEEYDLAVICGDFTTYGSPEYLKKVLDLTKKIMILAVPGNCYPPETVEALEKAHACVHNKQVDFGKWHFFGFGGSIPTSAAMPFEVEEKTIERSLRAIAVRRGVMITHQPPYGINDCGRSGNHGGSKSILNIAKEFSPRLVLSGHMHESRGVANLGETTYVNPGSAKNGHYASIWLGEEIRTKLHEE